MGGNEIISTEDMKAEIEMINEGQIGWSKWSWWEGKTTKSGEFICCSKCAKDEGEPPEPAVSIDCEVEEECELVPSAPAVVQDRGDCDECECDEAHTGGNNELYRDDCEQMSPAPTVEHDREEDCAGKNDEKKECEQMSPAPAGKNECAEVYTQGNTGYCECVDEEALRKTSWG